MFQASINAEKGYDVSLPDWYQHTALHVAAETGKTELAGILLDKGANANAIDRRGNTAITSAKDEAMIDFLLSKGVNPMDQSCATKTFLKAAEDNKLYLMKLIFEKYTRKTFNIDVITKPSATLH